MSTVNTTTPTPRLYITSDFMAMPIVGPGVVTFIVDATKTSIAPATPFLIESELAGFSRAMRVAMFVVDAGGQLGEPFILFERADVLDGVSNQWRLVQDAQIEIQGDLAAQLNPSSAPTLEIALVVERADVKNIADLLRATAMFSPAAPFPSSMAPASVDSSALPLPVTVTGGNFVLGDTEVLLTNTAPPFNVVGPLPMVVTGPTTGTITVPGGPPPPAGPYTVRAQLTSAPATGTTTPVAIFTITPF